MIIFAENGEGQSGVSRCPERAPLTLQATICFSWDDDNDDSDENDDDSDNDEKG